MPFFQCLLVKTAKRETEERQRVMTKRTRKWRVNNFLYSPQSGMYDYSGEVISG